MVEIYEDTEASVRMGDPAAVARLRDAVAARRDQVGEHARWGRLCELAGEPGLALTEYQLALRDSAEDVAALSRLTILYEERGDADRAIECAERWARAAPGDGEAVGRLVDLLLSVENFERAHEVIDGPLGETLESEARHTWKAKIRAAVATTGEDEEAGEILLGFPSDADAVRFLHLFSGRENVYARQWAAEGGEGGYSPVREPLTVNVVRNHLLGNITVGVYPVRLDNTVTFFAFDIDIRKQALARARRSLAEARRVKEVVAREAQRIRSELEGLGIPALLEDSGYKGRHLWAFLEVPEDAAVARQFGSLFLRCCPVTSPDVQVEFFPKQASTGGGIGNLIKLPLGIHRRTGRRSRLLLPEETAYPDPYLVLRQHPRLSREAFYGAISVLKARQVQPEPATPSAQEPPGEVPAAAEQAEIREAFPAPPPGWTAADFETNAEIAHILRHCPAVAALKTKVEQHRRLSHDEQIVLMHSLGHSGAGVLAVNYLLEACVDVSPSMRLQSPLAGNPISCPKIRKRIPQITAAVPCNCRFDFAPERYPTPRLHLLTLQAGSGGPPPEAVRPPPAWDPGERGKALRVLRIRRQELDGEITRLESELFAYMESAGLLEIAVGEAVLRLVQEQGAPAVLVWASRSPGDEASAPGTEPKAGE